MLDGDKVRKVTDSFLSTPWPVRAVCCLNLPTADCRTSCEAEESVVLLSCICFRFGVSQLDCFALASADRRKPILRVALAFGAAARDDTNLWLRIT